MNVFKNKDYSTLDRPEILAYVFHPRQEITASGVESTGVEIMMPVDENAEVSGRFHVGSEEMPNLLFFHGNGEIVADYDPMGSLFNQSGINFLAVDYRRYGRSTGSPTVSCMMKDCHKILEYAEKWLVLHHFTGSVFVMGRSLGSASALELAASRPESVSGIVLESAFAFTGPLLSSLGLNLEPDKFDEQFGFCNIEKIKAYEGPTLIIHGENDHIIPFSDGQALYEASPSQNKTLLKIPEANHNDIFLHGFYEYMTAVKKFVGSAA